MIEDTISIQEMFNRAWNGLRSQGFQVCKNSSGDCVYQNTDGLRCAWGYVDTTLTVEGLCVDSLRKGVAARLNPEKMRFACDLQNAHDYANSRLEVQANMVKLAYDYELEIPITEEIL